VVGAGADLAYCAFVDVENARGLPHGEAVGAEGGREVLRVYPFEFDNGNERICQPRVPAPFVQGVPQAGKRSPVGQRRLAVFLPKRRHIDAFALCVRLSYVLQRFGAQSGNFKKEPRRYARHETPGLPLGRTTSSLCFVEIPPFARKIKEPRLAHPNGVADFSAELNAARHIFAPFNNCLHHFGAKRHWQFPAHSLTPILIAGSGAQLPAALPVTGISTRRR
jgi:hypothetical protein